MQCLGRQNDLPQSCRANALAQGGFDRVDQRIWNDLLKRLGFCLIDKRPIRARNNKIDFYLAEITQDALQNFFRFASSPKIAARMRAFDRDESVACENDRSCAFAQNHSAVLFAERFNRRLRTQQTPPPVSIASQPVDFFGAYNETVVQRPIR